MSFQRAVSSCLDLAWLAWPAWLDSDGHCRWWQGWWPRPMIFRGVVSHFHALPRQTTRTTSNEHPYTGGLAPLFARHLDEVEPAKAISKK